MKSSVILIILDGWGIAPPSLSNAIALANTPYIDKLSKTYPCMLLDAGGQTVGLPWGAIGNSEVGHLVIGAGRIIYQDLPRINQSILNGEFFNNKAFLKAINYAKKNNSNLHLIGLVSGAGGHSYDKHLYSLLEMAKKQDFKNVFIHVILDGRDSPYNSGVLFVSELLKEIGRIGVGKIASLSGRYFAMDRDKHWDRTEKAYNAIVNGKADGYYKGPLEAIKIQYDDKNYDEEFQPAVIVDDKDKPLATISPNDSVIFFNFRPDRMRQLTSAFALKEFAGFKRDFVSDLRVVTMTQYEISLPVEVAFHQTEIEDSLAQVISRDGLLQLHVAETEKYAHITYFLGGGHETPWPGEENILVPSTKAKSYDLKPAMSAKKITNIVLDKMQQDKFSLIAVNFANADMVGHTGNFEATVKAVEILDRCIRKIVSCALKKDMVTLITADHGNAEQMQSAEGEKDKEHSDNPVPCIIVGNSFKKAKIIASEVVAGGLYDIAPTIIDLLGLPQSSFMSGKSLLSYISK